MSLKTEEVIKAKYEIELGTKESKFIEDFCVLIKKSPERLIEKIVNKEIVWMKDQLINHQNVIFEDYPIKM